MGSLALGNDGNFYGATFGGGVLGGFGTIFQVSPSGTFQKIHDFDGLDGQNVSAGLTLGKDGNFYGVSTAFESGTVFRITPGGAFISLDTFDGYTPAAALTLAANGSFYGVTDGPNVTGNGSGTVFRLRIVRHRRVLVVDHPAGVAP
jgi:uncharacterized repeat protein (TIGR03803 family)